MFKKLDKMLERFDKLNELVGDSEVIARMDEWRAYIVILYVSSSVAWRSPYIRVSPTRTV